MWVGQGTWSHFTDEVSGAGGEERGSGRRPEGGKDAEGGGEGQLSQEGGKDGKKQNPVGRVMAPPKEGKPVNVFCYMAKNN